MANSKGIKAGDWVRFVGDVREDPQHGPLGKVLVNKGQRGVVRKAPYDEFLEVELDNPAETGCGGIGCYASDVEKVVI